MNLEIANRLVKLRRTKGLSQEDLASKLGVSRQAVSKWERAESSPDTDNLIALARLYGISLDELLLHSPAGGSGGCAYAAAPEPEPRDEAREEREADDDAAVLAAALEWEQAEAKLEKVRQKAREKRMEKLNWPLTLVLMVLLPMLSLWLGVGDIYPIVTVIFYLVTGFLLGNWHPGWMLFLSIPIYEYLLHAV